MSRAAVSYRVVANRTACAGLPGSRRIAWAPKPDCRAGGWACRRSSRAPRCGVANPNKCPQRGAAGNRDISVISHCAHRNDPGQLTGSSSEGLTTPNGRPLSCAVPAARMSRKRPSTPLASRRILKPSCSREILAA